MGEKDLHYENHLCPVCGKYVFDYGYDYCDVCGWCDDPVQYKDHDYEGGANKMSLNEAKEAYRRGETIE